MFATYKNVSSEYFFSTYKISVHVLNNVPCFFKGFRELLISQIHLCVQIFSEYMKFPKNESGSDNLHVAGFGALK